ncbi:hypothetical protein LEP1GSC203_3412 [Leptospira terpstrae serovar Hualin str. LT 11-33 = ATCC 700639]|uniref:Uncharacterized protein n=1 Tax=Leptospira terpstrae serovar Hualin str. LT 11-33 = ATCC 700639 TaxID=1257025 RepID=N1W0J7_9LEPT|nr:hypothetical protein LEP1GSC203_3412 [Leptospira terpstrae serovar Hualin str. LT 11-33 = ATCC 700639]
MERDLVIGAITTLFFKERFPNFASENNDFTRFSNLFAINQ